LRQLLEPCKFTPAAGKFPQFFSAICDPAKKAI